MLESPVWHAKLLEVRNLQDALTEDLLPSLALRAPHHATISASRPVTTHQGKTNNYLTCGELFYISKAEALLVLYSLMAAFTRAVISSMSSEKR
jgi:hypothetical protein